MSFIEPDEYEPFTLTWKKAGGIAAGLGLLAVLGYLTRDLPSHEVDAIYRLGEAAIVAAILLWSFRKPQGEVGAPPVQERKDRKDSWWTVAFLLALAALAWFDPLKVLETALGFYPIVPLLIALPLGFGLYMLRKGRRERDEDFAGAIEAENQGIFALVLAGAFAAIWGLSFL